MAKPRLLFNGRLDGNAKILNWAKQQKSLFFHEGGFEVTVLAQNALVKAEFEARGLTVVNPRIASKWTDWNDFDVVVSPDLASPAGALWGGTLSGAQRQWLHNTLNFKGKLGLNLMTSF